MLQRQKLELPDGATKLLLHSCCAPCSGEVMEALIFQKLILRFTFITLIFIQNKNMKFVKMKIFNLLISIISLSLMLIMIKIIGLNV
jgi:hypothetical protein